jgi:PIN domain nuclease of toxin-antitoxin system
MKLLLDTQALLWFMTGDERLSSRARRLIEDNESELFFSAASVWEMAIKSSLGRLSLPVPAAEYVAEKIERGLRVLAVEWTHAAAVEKLPFHHRDPFDRLIIAQAIEENLPIITSNSIFRKYKASVIW